MEEARNRRKTREPVKINPIIDILIPIRKYIIPDGNFFIGIYVILSKDKHDHLCFMEALL